MGFISFNESYYLQKLEALEKKELTSEEIYEVQQLLKVLDDLTDEGYTNLNDRMEGDFSCLTRLRNLLKKACAVPFQNLPQRLSSTFYGTEKHELFSLMNQLMAEASKLDTVSKDSFLQQIYEYAKGIDYEKDTAYVFLLRDTLLPYVYFKSRQREHVYPWLLSRRFLEDITGIPNVDDDIRLPIYEALESGCSSFDDFFSFCQKRIQEALDHHPELKKILMELLGSLQEKKIVVVESGYMGTLPMMLKALDSRVTFRLYTTAPFLYETYKDDIFCRKYEDIRKFETVDSQNSLLQYASYRDGKFYVNLSEDNEIRNRSLMEIKAFME